MLKGLLILLGTGLMGFGLLFALQGAGLVHWPESSFMLDQRAWIARGLLVMVAGAATLLVAKRIR